MRRFCGSSTGGRLVSLHFSTPVPAPARPKQMARLTHLADPELAGPEPASETLRELKSACSPFQEFRVSPVPMEGVGDRRVVVGNPTQAQGWGRNPPV